MTLKAPLKISAVGLGLLAIAVSSCNKGSTGSANNTPAPLDPKGDVTNQEIKKLTLEVTPKQIPSGSCSKYQVFATTNNDQVINITNSMLNDISLANDEFFTLDKEKKLLCAYTTAQKSPTSTEHTATLVATHSNHATHIYVSVAQALEVAEIEAITVPDTPIGTATKPFEIKIKKTLNAKSFTAIQSAENFDLLDASGNNVELKLEEAGKFSFEIPTTAQQGVNQYTLQYKNNPTVTQTIAVNVTPAKITSFTLKNFDGNSVNVFNGSTTVQLFGNFSDNTSKNLSVPTSAPNSDYTITPISTEITKIAGQNVFIKYNSNPQDKFNPQEAKFSVTNKTTNQTESASTLFYFNAKPTLTIATLDQNKNTVAIGGAAEAATEWDNRCAKFIGAKYTLADNIEQTVAMNQLKITLPKNSNFEVKGDVFVCATAKAKPTEEVIATVSSAQDDSVQITQKITAGATYLTNNIALVDSSGSKVTDYKIQLSASQPSHTLKFKLLNSDGTVSNKEVAGNDVTLSQTQNDYITINHQELKVSVAEGKLAELQKINNFAHTITVKSEKHKFPETHYIVTFK